MSAALREFNLKAKKAPPPAPPLPAGVVAGPHLPLKVGRRYVARNGQISAPAVENYFQTRVSMKFPGKGYMVWYHKDTGLYGTAEHQPEFGWHIVGEYEHILSFAEAKQKVMDNVPLMFRHVVPEGHVLPTWSHFPNGEWTKAHFAMYEGLFQFKEA